MRARIFLLVNIVRPVVVVGCFGDADGHIGALLHGGDRLILVILGHWCAEHLVQVDGGVLHLLLWIRVARGTRRRPMHQQGAHQWQAARRERVHRLFGTPIAGIAVLHDWRCRGGRRLC